MGRYYGLDLYGSGLYGGSLPAVYLLTDVSLITATKAKQYVLSDTLLNVRTSNYVLSNVFFQKKQQQYVHTDTNFVYTFKQYVTSDVSLNAKVGRYLFTDISFVYNLLPYEVDIFQVIVDLQNVKFYWSDSVNLANKSYTIYESLDFGKTWSQIVQTTNTSYVLPQIPFGVQSRYYKITISAGSLVSFGIQSQPVFSYRRFLNVLDNGYWDIDPNSNIYKMFEGIYKESFCRAEEEIDYTVLDGSIIKIRNSRISDVWGTAFGQLTSSADENYKRKIWNLLIGYRNTTTYKGIYYITKAFTGIPPVISKLSQDGWILGKRYLGKDTIPQSQLTSLYGSSLKIHLPKVVSGVVQSSPDSTSIFDTTSTGLDIFNITNGFYKDNYLVFKTGNNAYRSKKITNYIVGTTSSRFITQPFTQSVVGGDLFFVTSVSTTILESYIKKGAPAHSSLLFKYFADYITENSGTGFAGVLSNLEVLQSRRLRLKNVDVLINDNGKLVQGFYDSGTTLTRSSQLALVGAQGIVCWDDIEWGDSNVDFRMYLTFTSSLSSNNWVYQTGKTQFFQFNGLQEYILEEYIKQGSETVFDTSGNSFINGIDYLIDYRNGTIRRTNSSHIASNALVVVTYNVEWGQVQQNQVIQFTKPFFKYRFTVSNLVRNEEWEFSGLYIKRLS